MSAPVPERGSNNPFIRYRWLLDSYRKALSGGWGDDDYVALVHRLDEAVAEIDGHGFLITPLSSEPSLAAALKLHSSHLWVKDETGNVGGSHKARHLFGVLLHHAIDESIGGELAIASCGNAAVAAAVLAKAVDRPLRVFIPTWADENVVALLRRLEARIEVAERRPGETGDPTYLRFLEAIELGLVPFSVQSPATPTTIDGGRTLGWELAEQLALARVLGVVHLFVQVGGGALAAATWQGINDGIREQWLAAGPVLHTVQTEASAPLNRAWQKVRRSDDVETALLLAAIESSEYMWSWENVGTSAASGILDDVTYEWHPLVEAMLTSGGAAHVVNEDMVTRAHELSRSYTDIKVDPTGSAGLAALLDPQVSRDIGPDDHVVVLFTGLDRHTPRTIPPLP